MGEQLPLPAFKLEDDERRALAVYPLTNTRSNTTTNFHVRAVCGSQNREAENWSVSKPRKRGI